MPIKITFPPKEIGTWGTIPKVSIGLLLKTNSAYTSLREPKPFQVVEDEILIDAPSLLGNGKWCMN